MEIYPPMKVLRHPVPLMGKDDSLVLGEDRYVVAGRRFNGYDLRHAERPSQQLFLTYSAINESVEQGKAAIAYGGNAPTILELDWLYKGKKFDDFSEKAKRIARLRVKLFMTYDEQHLRGNAPPRNSETFDEWIRPYWADIRGPVRSDSVSNIVEPSVATFNRLYKNWLKYDRNILAIMPRYAGPGKKATVFTPESINLAVTEARTYMSRLKPRKVDVFNMYKALLSKANEVLLAEEQPLLEKLGKTSFYKIIDSLPQFEVAVARTGEEAALKKFAPNLGMYDEVVPGARCEIDELMTDMATIFAKAGVLESATEKQKAVLKRIRVWIVVIIDVATRYVVAANVVTGPSARATLETLRLMMTDKTYLSDILGSPVPWFAKLCPAELYMDHGSAFAADEVHDALVALGIQPTRPPAGTPKKRPHIESLFHTIGPLFTQFFDGRTFRSIEEKGDYDPKLHASLAADEFAAIINRGICMHYNMAGHGALGGRSPHNVFVDAVEGYGWKVIPPRAQLIRALGKRHTGQMTREGIVRLGIPYNNDLLVTEHMNRGGGRHSQSFECIFDDGYLNSILVKMSDGEWIEVENRIELPENLAVEEWDEARKAEREKNRAETQLSYPLIRDFLLRNRETGLAATLRAKLDPTVPSPAKLEKQRAQLYRGFVASAVSGAAPADEAPMLPPPDPLRAGTVARARPAELQPAPTPKLGKTSKLVRSSWDDD